MEDRVKINGVWYVKETKITKEELDIIDFVGCTYENDKYCWEATVLYKDGIDIKFTDKRTKPFKEDNWDKNTWLLGVLKNDRDSMTEAREAMDEDGIETFQIFLEYLKGKQWL